METHWTRIYDDTTHAVRVMGVTWIFVHRISTGYCLSCLCALFMCKWSDTRHCLRDDNKRPWNRIRMVNSVLYYWLVCQKQYKHGRDKSTLSISQVVTLLRWCWTDVSTMQVKSNERAITLALVVYLRRRRRRLSSRQSFEPLGWWNKTFINDLEKPTNKKKAVNLL